MRRILIALCITLGLSACRLDSLGPEGRVSGTYELETVNGYELPVTFSGGATLTSEQLDLDSDGSYTLVSHYSNASTYIERGEFTSNNGDIQFEPDDIRLDVYGGSVTGSSLTIFSESYRSVYRKN